MPYHALRPPNLILTLALLLLAAWAPPSAAQPAPDLCTSTAVPATECAALVDFYIRTDGANWLNNTNWLTATANAPCDWFGVSCAGGRVIGLELPRNQLSGQGLGPLTALPALQTLDLAGNQLAGPVAATICQTARQGVQADLSYNALFSRRADTRTCLSRLDPDWAATQALPPLGLQVGDITDSSITVAWDPATTSVPGAYYEIAYATQSDDPFTVHGRTSDLQATNYTLAGLNSGFSHRIQIQMVAPPHAGNPGVVRSITTGVVAATASTQQVLLMVYFPADNDLSPNLPIVLERIRQGSLLNPNAQVVALMDGGGSNDSQLLAISAGVVTSLDALAAQFGNEVNSADEDVLAWFISYARTSYPAEREYLSLMGHGLALAPEVAWPQQRPALADAELGNLLPALPRGMPATPGDVTDNGYMSTVALGRALAAATDNGANPLDLIFFDQCFQGNLDTLYEVRNTATMFVASPNYAWLAAPYDEYLALMAPANTPAQVAEAIVVRYQRNLDNRHPNAIFAVSAAEVNAIAAAAGDLAAALTRAVQAGRREPIALAARDGQYVDTTQCGRQNLSLGPPDELIGLGPFAANLRANFGSGDPDGVNAAAEAVLLSLQNIVKTFRVGNPYLDPTEFWDYNATLTVLTPLPANTPDAVAWRSSIYTETVPLDAVWTPVDNQQVQVTASYAFVRDYGWDEFLAAWFNRPRTPTVGEWCHFVPPVLVESQELETFPLRANSAGNDLILGWDSSQADDIAGHWIYLRGPFAVGWQLHRIEDVDVTTATLSDLEADAQYQVMVVTRDTSGATVARSEPQTVSGPNGTYRLALPWLAQ